MLRYFPAERRRRLAPLILLGGLLTAGKLTYDDAPRDQEVHFLLPYPGVQALRVTYEQGDDLYAGLERRFPEGSPTELVHTPSLSPGRYDLAIELTSPEGVITQLRRSLTVPHDGILRVRLADDP